jgi:hypothetical protein
MLDRFVDGESPPRLTFHLPSERAPKNLGINWRFGRLC